MILDKILEPKVPLWCLFGKGIAVRATQLSDSKPSRQCVVPAHAVGAASLALTFGEHGPMASTNVPFQFAEPATVSILKPSTGLQGKSSLVQVVGSNFLNLPSLRCFFGNTESRARWISESLVSCRSPKLDSKLLYVTVSNNGVDKESHGLVFEMVTRPVLTSLSPTIGSTLGGLLVTVTGANFEDHHQPLYVREEPLQFELVSSTQGHVRMPPRHQGPVNVSMAPRPEGKPMDYLSFLYVEMPQLTMLEPSLGQMDGGTAVTVHGTFRPDTLIKCYFGAQPSAQTTIESSSHLLCLSPRFQTADFLDRHFAPVHVTYNDVEFTSSDLEFVYHVAPTISGIFPSHSEYVGGTSITLMGAHFQNVDALTASFGSIAGGKVALTWLSSSRAECHVPQLPSAANVSVEISYTGKEYFKSREQMHYSGGSLQLALSPSRGPVLGSSVITVMGHDFRSHDTFQCMFGDRSSPGSLSGGVATCVSSQTTAASMIPSAAGFP